MTKLKTLRIAAMAAVMCAGTVALAQDKPAFAPGDHAVFATDREDGRYISSRGIAHRMMANHLPSLRYRAGMDSASFAAWRQSVAAAMDSLMCPPGVVSIALGGKDAASMPAPRMVSSEPREGYSLQRWEAYPLNESVVTFLVLVPDGADAAHPVPGILCVPGFGQTKELLAGEAAQTPAALANAQALYYVREGYVAVAVDNPGCGEPGDLERAAGRWASDYVNLSRALLELGWSYLGYTAYVDGYILDWMKTQPYIRRDRLVVSGFSLGTEPLMAIGTRDPEIFAFVYNDFLCDTRERALVMTLPNDKGERPWPNDISHLIPGFLTRFDFPDLVAALAPRPVICTEGGMDRDFNRVADAFATAGVPEAFTPYHYAKYADPADRVYLDELPAGINRDTFFKLANVDPPRHYFKAEHVLPWLRGLFQAHP